MNDRLAVPEPAASILRKIDVLEEEIDKALQPSPPNPNHPDQTQEEVKVKRAVEFHGKVEKIKKDVGQLISNGGTPEEYDICRARVLAVIRRLLVELFDVTEDQIIEAQLAKDLPARPDSEEELLDQQARRRRTGLGDVP